MKRLPTRNMATTIYSTAKNSIKVTKVTNGFFVQWFGTEKPFIFIPSAEAQEVIWRYLKTGAVTRESEKEVPAHVHRNRGLRKILTPEGLERRARAFRLASWRSLKWFGQKRLKEAAKE